MSRELSPEEQQELAKALRDYLKTIVDYCRMSQGQREIYVLVQNDVIDYRMERIEKQLKEIQETIGKFKA